MWEQGACARVASKPSGGVSGVSGVSPELKENLETGSVEMLKLEPGWDCGACSGARVGPKALNPGTWCLRTCGRHGQQGEGEGRNEGDDVQLAGLHFVPAP